MLWALMQRAMVDRGSGAGSDWLVDWEGLGISGLDGGGPGCWSGSGAGLVDAEDGASMPGAVDAVGASGLAGSSGPVVPVPVCCCGASSMSFRSLAKISVSSAVAGCTQVSLRWRDGDPIVCFQGIITGNVGGVFFGVSGLFSRVYGCERK